MTGRLSCPWCGRELAVPKSGVAPKHKRVVGAHPTTGAVVRAWCDGGGELPAMVSAERRRHLRTQWRDEGGELIGDQP
jgi:hypothetical protein